MFNSNCYKGYKMLYNAISYVVSEPHILTIVLDPAPHRESRCGTGSRSMVGICGSETWLICGSKEAKLSNITFWGPLRDHQKGVLDSFGFLWAANQPGFSPQAVNIHHPTELSRSEFETYFPCGSYTPSAGPVGREYRGTPF